MMTVSDHKQLQAMLIQALLVLAGICCLGVDATAGQESSVSTEATQSDADKAQIAVEILGIETDVDQKLPRAVNPIQTLRIRIQVTNNSSEAATLKSETLSLRCDDRECAFNVAVPDPLLPDDIEVAAGESVSGWVMFSVFQKLNEGSDLRLSWTIGDRTMHWSLIDELRRLLELQSEIIGPKNCLAVLTLNNKLDLRMKWVLSREFKELSRAGIQRVVVVSFGESSSPQRSQNVNWLKSARAGDENARPPFGQRITSPVQFAEFHIAGFGVGSSRVPNNTNSFMHADREHAVAAALRDIYRDLPLQDAIKELDRQDAGIRRAALTNTIDRLHADQLRTLISEARSNGSVEQQALVAEVLARVADPEVVDDLKHFALASDKQVSQAALKSLVHCLSPKTSQTMKEIWLFSRDKPTFRSDIVQVVLASRDYRWMPLLAEYAETQLAALTANSELPMPDSVDERVSQADQLPGLPPGPDGPQSSAAIMRASETQTLKQVLEFLKEQRHPEFIQVARSQLLKISKHEIQDVVLGFVLDSGRPEDNALIRQYIRQRLPQGRMSSELINTIRQFPDTQYTEELLRLSKSSALRSHERRSVLTLALRCASDDQMNLIIDDFSEMDRYSKPLALQQLAAIDHPRWMDLAKDSIYSDDTSLFNTAMATFRNHASPEVLAILVDRMDAILAQIESGEELNTSEVRKLQQFVTSVGAYTHPDARRTLNRCYISTFPVLREHARGAMARIIARSPGYSDFVNMDRASRERRHEDAMAHANAAIKKDPFMADALHSRASLFLVQGEVALAYDDLIRSSQLNPEDTVADSTLAITRVRMGHLTEGLAEAEAILERVPPDVTSMYTVTLYNTACAHARALDLPDLSEADRKESADRAMDLMFQSAELGFYDAEHTAWDPDLQSLHGHKR